MSSYKGLLYVSAVVLILLQGDQVVRAAVPDASGLRGLGVVDSAVGFKSPIPLPVTGQCRAGDVYKVNSLRYLYDNASILECIFAAGLEPKNVPLGFGYGYVLSMANTGFWSPIAQIPYQGDYVVKTQCRGNFYNIGWLSIAGLDVGTAVWTIDELGWDLAPGEYPEGDKKSILMDFSVDMKKLCAPEGNESPLGLIGFSPFANSIFPVATFKDIGRVVGVDTDGGTILLNKALTTSPGKGAQTVLIYAMKTFDSSVRPDGFGPGTTITVPPGPNGETTIAYNRQGLEGVIARTIGILANPALLKREVEKRDAEERSELLKNLPQSDVADFSPANVVSMIAQATGLFGQESSVKQEERENSAKKAIAEAESA